MKWNQSSVFSESATMDKKYRSLYEDYNPSDQRSSLGTKVVVFCICTIFLCSMLLNVFFITGSYHGEKHQVHEPPITAHKAFSVIFNHADGKCAYQDDLNNVVSTQLEGSWGINLKISKVLSPKFAPPFNELKFQKNESVLDIFPTDFCDKIDVIYFMGEMTQKKDDKSGVAPFVLTNIDGNPILAILTPKDGVQYWYVMMARAENRTDDMLFLAPSTNTGGETSAWKRIE